MVMTELLALIAAVVVELYLPEMIIKEEKEK